MKPAGSDAGAATIVVNSIAPATSIAPLTAAIVRAIVDLGRHLGLEVVAEGVEDADTHEMLVDMGCDLVQGWHLARPMPPEEFLPWLATRAHTARRRGLRVV